MENCGGCLWIFIGFPFLCWFDGGIGLSYSQNELWPLGEAQYRPMHKWLCRGLDRPLWMDQPQWEKLPLKSANVELAKTYRFKIGYSWIQITRKWDKLRSNVAPWGSPVLKGKICVPKWFQISVVQVAIFSIMATTSRCSIHVATYLCVDLYLNAVTLSMHIYNIRIHCVYHIAMLCAYIYVYTVYTYI